MTPIYRISSSLRKALAALLALTMLSGCMAGAESQTDVNSVRVSSAPLTTGSATKNGMVRVYLSSLGSPTTLNLTVNGSYSVNGNTSRTLSGGASATIGFSTSTGAITLSYGGEKYNMGKSFALRRHSASGASGIKIRQAKEPNNAYPGDISFKAVSSGGGYKLYTIAHIYIENYLYGVLPYEMGNSTNIEALKAQAVAARTYTVRMMNSRAGSDYDVVDTTSDQVYRGTPSGNANCVSAVDQTKGIVLMYGSSYAMTYYSASNGGQTESARNLWGSTGYDYLVVKDDPFDYSNTSSTVKSKTVYKDLTSGLNSASLIALLKSKAVTALSRAGYNANSGNTSLVSLTSVTPHTPKYGSPSRLYTKMDFTLQARVNGASASCTVTCDIFGELESMLSMSIQSAQNELWSVKSGSSAFTLQARRYGHAIGLSQRGAMYMAKLGYSYDQILGFYYEGCKRVRHSFTNTILSVSGDTQTTIEDPADVDEDDDACKGTVRLVSAGASIAIRASKSTSGAILGTAGNGAIMNVFASDGQWCFVQYGDIKGYLPANSLQISGAPTGAEGAPSTVEGFATVTANDFVNLRQSGSMEAGIVSTAPSGAVMTVFSRSGAWARVQYCATVAYVNTNYVSITSGYPSHTVSTGSATATVTAEGGADMLASPSTGAQVLARLAQGAQLKVSSDDGSWASVSYEGMTGYVLAGSISYDGESLDNPQGGDSGGAPAAPGEGSGGTGSTTATVSADVGFLREQPDANSSSIMVIGGGETVTVTSRGAEWCAVSIAGVSGYMLTSSLGFAGGGGAASIGMATVTTQSGSLNLRAEAQAGSAVLTTIPRFAQVQLTSIGAAWCGVSYNGVNGYCMTSFLTIEGQQSPITPVPGTGGGSAVVATQSGSLNLRAEPRTGSQILTTIPQYASVTVNSYGDEWCAVTYMGVSGYSMTVFLSFAQPGGTPADGTGTPADGTPSDGTGTPADGTGTPADGTPTDGTGTPTDGTGTPTDGTGTPTDGTGTPTDGTSTPSDGTGTPADGDVNDPSEPLVPDETDASTLYAVVSTVSGSLNLRLDAMPGSDVLARIPKGATIVIDERLSAWSRTTYAGQTGYVMNSYLTFHQGQQSSANAQRAIVSTQSGSLNLRTEPSADAGVILRIPQYAAVDVEQRGATWCYIRYGLSMGYVMTSFLTFENDSATGGASADGSSADGSSASGEAGGAPASDPSTAKTAYVQTASGSLNLRVSPTSGARIITTIPRNHQVQIVSYGENWCQVLYDAYAGYVVTSYLRFETAAATAQGTEGAGVMGATTDGSTGSTVTGTDGSTGSTGTDGSTGSTGTDGSTGGSTDGSTGSTGGTSTGASTDGSTSGSTDGSTGSTSTGASTDGSTGNTGTDGSTGSTGGTGGASTDGGASNPTPAQPDQSTGTDISNTSRLIEPTDAWVATPTGSLNMRREPDDNARVLITIPRHAKVDKYTDTGVWSYVSYKGEYGYVASSYLADEDPALLVDKSISGWQESVESEYGSFALDLTMRAPDDAIYAFAAPRDGSDRLRAWEQCSEQSVCVVEIPKGEQVAIILIGDNWCLVQYTTIQGYCPRECLEVITP